MFLVARNAGRLTGGEPEEPAGVEPVEAVELGADGDVLVDHISRVFWKAEAEPFETFVAVGTFLLFSVLLGGATKRGSRRTP